MKRQPDKTRTFRGTEGIIGHQFKKKERCSPSPKVAINLCLTFELPFQLPLHITIKGKSNMNYAKLGLILRSNVNIREKSATENVKYVGYIKSDKYHTQERLHPLTKRTPTNELPLLHLP